MMVVVCVSIGGLGAIYNFMIKWAIFNGSSQGFKLGSEKHTTEVTVKKSGGLQVISGIEGLAVLKTTQVSSAKLKIYACPCPFVCVEFKSEVSEFFQCLDLFRVSAMKLQIHMVELDLYNLNPSDLFPILSQTRFNNMTVRFWRLH